MGLTLGEHWPAWHPTARRGVLETEHGDRPVLALLAPHQPSGVSKAREQAASALELTGEGILPLLAIRAVHQRIAWIYDAVDGVSVGHIERGPGLGPRAAAELMLAVARVIVPHPHPGPEPDDVLLTARGVRVANFAKPFPSDPAFRAPQSTDPRTEAARVFRLGALFASALSAPLSPSSTQQSHEAAVRRAVIRAMSRPGAVFSDPYGAFLRALLAWNPAQRPPLSRVIPGLEELVATTGGPSLEDVVGAKLTGWLLQSLDPDVEETTLPQDWEQVPDVIDPALTVEAPGRRTLGDDAILGTLHDEDEPTVDSELGVVPREHTPPSVIERGSIPVAVGPPVEEAARRPRLPTGFLEEATVAHDDPDLTVRSPTESAPPPPRPWMPIAAGVLLLFAVLLAAIYATMG